MAGVVVVTGASRGIGAATAKVIAAAGHAVVVNYAGDAKAAAAVVPPSNRPAASPLSVQADVSDPVAVEGLFAVADRLGSLVGLVNNAGIINPTKRVEDMEAAAVTRLLAVNVTGSILCAKEAIRRMSTRHGGKGGGIVNLSSGAAKLGAPGSYVDYAASKGAIDSFTVGLALELADEGIRVNAVRPGLIDTEFHAAGGDPGRVQRLQSSVPMRRGGTPEEVAKAVLWLLSDEAAYTTGTTIAVSGGRAILP